MEDTKVDVSGLLQETTTTRSGSSSGDPSDGKHLFIASRRKKNNFNQTTRNGFYGFYLLIFQTKSTRKIIKLMCYIMFSDGN